ncbi:PRC-barrel domain containing protein [Micromonospora harpali]|uniref:PRC-barrel domain containing protein n=1 Tax=Micromonospora harpali TaxID=1490225 RepID=A0ABW1HR34_9ACTN|nr:PRC-barrel domain containing protein [Micromonospora sp. NBRC 110038]
MDRLDPHAATGTPDPMRHGDQGAIAGGAPAGAFDPWSYRDRPSVADADLVGYHVEATDGGIGKIDSASHEVGGSYLVVDTGPWIFGRKVMLPAGTVNHVDHDARTVYVDRERDQIKAAPEYDEDSHSDPAFRDRLGGYYDESYGNLPPGTAR